DSALVPAPSVVNTTADHDDGSCDAADCTLREAINAVNAAAGGAIQFDIPGGAAPTITLSSALPTVAVPVTIDATTQPGTPANTPGVTIVPAGGAVSGVLLDLGPG